MQTEKKLRAGEIPAGIMAYILRSLQEICFGQVVLVAQNFRLIQVERNEKLRVTDWERCQGRRSWSDEERTQVRQRIQASFFQLEYGQLVIVVKGGSIVQMERTEKCRFTGLDGEGI